MGADITAYLERQPDPQVGPRMDLASGPGPWWCLARDLFIPRNYTLFTLLGRVSGKSPPLTPIASLRGLPPLLSDTVQEAWEEFPGHAASYLTYEELVRVQETYSAREMDWYEAHLVPRDAQLGGDWEVFAQVNDAPRDLLRRVGNVPEPPPWGRKLEEFALALRHHQGQVGAHIELAAVIAFLGVYEQDGIATRMVFWFDQ